jgi:cytochrome c-type protein NapC
MRLLSKAWGALLKVVRLDLTTTVPAVFLAFLAGVIFWGGFNWSLEVTNTESFCISCHAMRDYVYKEYRKSVHFSNRTGVRASCPDCHVPKEWIYKVARKVRATNELFHWLRGSIDAPEDFKAKRLELARLVWASMEATDSRECRNCHGIDHMNSEAQAVKARTMHALGMKWGKSCIDCHQGIVHSLPQGFDKEAVMDELHDRMEKEKVDCRPCHEGMAGPPPGEGWD